MSRIAVSNAAQNGRPPDPDPIEAELDWRFNIKGKDGVVQAAQAKFGLPVSLRSVRLATNNRTLPSYLIGGACWYSERDIFRWLRSMRRSADDEAVAR
ncbi:hypothetical protein [Mycolicibacterium tusciae]|uniref:hypothetical protein n=1 Tax=Mycolicibacterium tusciae TaxID=75922 RepID=UPI00024A2342|nr:hypothetical protein [Mycolicibacterium tusciae]